MNSCKQWDLKPRVLKVNWLDWDRAWRAAYCSWKEGSKQPEDREHGNNDLKNTWGTHWETTHYFWSTSLRGSVQGDATPETKEVANTNFLPCPSEETQSQMREVAQH